MDDFVVPNYAELPIYENDPAARYQHGWLMAMTRKMHLLKMLRMFEGAEVGLCEANDQEGAALLAECEEEAKDELKQVNLYLDRLTKFETMPFGTVTEASRYVEEIWRK